jgi:thiol-disulfide isomerase/thioredoxin
MAGVAVAVIILLGGAIYSLSRFESTRAVVTLKDPGLQISNRRNLPQFEYTADEKTLSPQTLVGKWTLISFWAAWCQPCLDELPSLNQLGQNWQGPEFQVITINTDEPGSENFEVARDFITANEIELPTYFDKDGKLKKAFEVEAVPRHFLVNPKGEIVWEGQGAFTWNDEKTRGQLLKVMEMEKPPVPESTTESEE